MDLRVHVLVGAGAEAKDCVLIESQDDRQEGEKVLPEVAGTTFSPSSTFAI